MSTDKELNNNYLWLIAVVFLLLAVSFIFNLWGKSREIIQHPLAKSEQYSKNPVRKAKLAPIFEKDGFSYHCNDCHQNIEASKIQKSFFSSHMDITLDHGVNNYCKTCHSQDNREALVDINNQDIPFDQSQLTCLKCHGPIYRDWENGVHGRINGYWAKDLGEMKRLTCVQCHDPHQPKFQPMEPSPSPNFKNYQDFLKGLSIKDSSHES
ncbi:MAG: cytochrome c3 family protein [Candidatus Omnitrophica bacterium]|nr:cytochrome c3 family protein [Candidatus Omnitrophota bacterium]